MKLSQEEQALIKALQNPKTQERAFSTLVEQYQERLYWHIRKIVLTHDDTHDVLQNTFIKIFRYIRKFKGDSKLHTWMYRIAYNESVGFLRTKQNTLQLQDGAFADYLLNNLQQDIYFDGDQAQLKLQQAILKLSPKQARVFQMKYFEDLKFSEISKILDTSEGALKASYHHAVKKLKHLIHVQEVLVPLETIHIENPN